MGAEPRECVPEQPTRRRRIDWRVWMPLTLLTFALLLGVGFRLAGLRDAANLVWGAMTLAALLPAVWGDAAAAVAPAVRGGRNRRVTCAGSARCPLAMRVAAP